MKRLITIQLYLTSLICGAQQLEHLTIKGNYTKADSAHVTEAYFKASEAVSLMQKAMNTIWSGETKEEKMHRWENEKAFARWLGRPDKLRLVNRKIRKIRAKFDRQITLKITKENRGRCSGWISAWAIPFGKIRITLCEDFFVYRTHLQEKTLIHEIGHETGILFHRKIHGCRAARRAASSNDNIAKRSTENYAWLAMSYTGLECRN